MERVTHRRPATRGGPRDAWRWSSPPAPPRSCAPGGPPGFRVDAKSNATDLVTEVDRASERWLVDTIAQRRPGDAVLGEEGGAHGTDDVPGSAG